MAKQNELSPIVEQKWYRNEAGIWRLEEDGGLDESIVSVPALSAEHIVDNYNDLENLVWLSFYKQALVRILHTHAIGGEEQLRGERRLALQDQFVIDHSPEGFVFADKSEILKSGRFTPYMASWLGRIADHGAPWPIGADKLGDFEEPFGRPLTGYVGGYNKFRESFPVA